LLSSLSLFVVLARILTSLGHLGFARWKKPLVDFFTVQILEKGHLRACRNALLNYWYGHTRPGEDHRPPSAYGV
jgi:hypothetical protein